MTIKLGKKIIEIWSKQTIKKNFELVTTKTQLKRGTNEVRVSHIAFQNNK
jgi:hypothetical protein